MQTNSSFVSPVAHIPYPYHGAPPVPPQDHDLKRQWLNLLPPPQIIEICLAFDLHVPHYIKSTIWPSDLNAAIAAMKKTVPPESNTEKNDQPAAPTRVPASEDSGTTAAQQESTGEKQPPDKWLGSSTTPSAPTQPQASTSQQQPQHQSPPPPAHPTYPPYSYAHPHAPSAYPHNPYYPLTHGYPSYPHGSYPPYAPGTYQPPPGAAPAAHPYHASPPGQPPDPYGPNGSADDLPSYEEMIVEALQDSTDPEGCAPKDLFAWMASRYPVQSNFRPSASQALQKAFKRGRLEKSSGGKYRLSASWEGGNTSRRTTRRPQTQNQTSNGHPPTTSPFTHAPLVHPHHQPSNTQPPFQPGPYGYGYPPHPGYPGYTQLPAVQSQAQPQSHPPAQLAQQQTNYAPHNEGSTSAEDPTPAEVYEAAQNILKAINLGGLLQLAGEGDAPIQANQGAPTQLLEAVPDTGPANANATPSQAQVHQLGQPIAPQPSFEPAIAGSHRVPAPEIDPQLAASRSELQAQLALLAAQLAEYAQMDEVVTAPPGQLQLHPHPQAQAQPATVEQPVPLAPIMPVPAPPPESTPEVQGKSQQDCDDSEDDEDMEEII